MLFDSDMLLNGASRPGTTCPDLLRGVREADRDSWQTFVTAYGPQIYHWARQMNLQPDTAGDVVQAVFIVVLVKGEQFRKRHETDSFRAWLKTVTRNKSRDAMRASSRGPYAVGGSTWGRTLHAMPDVLCELSSEAAPSGTDPHKLLEHLEAIRQDVRTSTFDAFCMTVMEGRTSQEVAELLEMTPAAVRLAKARVLQKLRSAVAPKDS